MSKPADILNPQNPLLDSEEEDEDFEPEVPITNDGLFVHTRSGKGGDNSDFDEIEDVSVSLKRQATSIFEQMMNDDMKNEDQLRKKQKVKNGFIDLMATKENREKHFSRIVMQTEKSTAIPNASDLSSKTEEYDSTQKSIWDTINSLKEANADSGLTHVVKFAGKNIELSGGVTKSQSLDTLVESLEVKKTISTIDKSSYDWDKFKDKEGIKDEVEKAKENGYIEKQEFLSRVDMRKFDMEREQRERERIQRENEKRHHQRMYYCLLQENN